MIKSNLMIYYPATFLATANVTTEPLISPNLPPSWKPTTSYSNSPILQAPQCSSQLADENNEVDDDTNQEEIRNFFRLDSVPIDDIQINSFLQECSLAKTNYFQAQEIHSSTFSVQPKTLDDIIQGDFEKKSIIPYCGLVNPTSKIDHLPKHLQSCLNDIF